MIAILFLIFIVGLGNYCSKSNVIRKTNDVSCTLNSSYVCSVDGEVFVYSLDQNKLEIIDVEKLILRPNTTVDYTFIYSRIVCNNNCSHSFNFLNVTTNLSLFLDDQTLLDYNFYVISFMIGFGPSRIENINPTPKILTLDLNYTSIQNFIQQTFYFTLKGVFNVTPLIPSIKGCYYLLSSYKLDITFSYLNGFTVSISKCGELYRYFLCGSVGSPQINTSCFNENLETDSEFVMKTHLIYSLPSSSFLIYCFIATHTIYSVEPNSTINIHCWNNSFVDMKYVESPTTININETNGDNDNFSFATFSDCSFYIKMIYQNDYPYYVIITNSTNASIKINKLKHKILFILGSGETIYKLPSGDYLIQSKVSKDSCSIVELSSQTLVNHCLNYEIPNNTTYLNCGEGYYYEDQECKSCGNNCELCSDEQNCIKCLSTYFLNDKECVQDSNCRFHTNDECISCFDGFYIGDYGYCVQCVSHCKICNGTYCVLCEDSYYNDDGYCQTISFPSIPDYCNDGFYDGRGICVDCSLFGNCEKCSPLGCLLCKNGYVMNGTMCIDEEQCVFKKEGKCVYCKDDEIVNNDDCLLVENCKETNRLGCCLECEKEYFISQNGSCIKNLKCSLSVLQHCLSCDDGYYLNNDFCDECQIGCKVCANNKKCIICENGYVLDNGSCVEPHLIIPNCTKTIFQTDFCIRCEEGFYMQQFHCEPCPSNCQLCSNPLFCDSCKPNYFFYEGNCYLNQPACLSYTLYQGCEHCVDGYYLSNGICIRCEDNCSSCNSMRCISCKENYVFNLSQCIEYKEQKNCVSTFQSHCAKCERGFELNQNYWCVATPSETTIKMVVGILISCFFLIILEVLGAYFYFSTHPLKPYKLSSSQSQTIIFLSCDSLQFGDNEIPLDIDQPFSQTITIFNQSQTSVSIQVTQNEDSERYVMIFDPCDMFVLKSNCRIDLKISLTPLCSCCFNNNLIIRLKNTKNMCEDVRLVPFSVVTRESHILDPNDIELISKIGSTPHSVIYSGTYRGVVVAIKKPKMMKPDLRCIQKLEREMNILHQIQNDFIVYYYGSTISQTNICIVFEHALFGSIQNNIDNKNRPEDVVILKWLRDICFGIEYLHKNHILHRDIKPDNCLIVSLLPNASVNIKLCDFGSAVHFKIKKHKSLVGTPMYMAPEILCGNKCSSATDIYSMSMTFYAIYTWKDPFSTSDFPFPWTIADFVTEGKRPPQQNVPSQLFDMIERGWRQNPYERFRISEILTLLNEL